MPTVLSTYPRARPELSAAHREIYEREYKLNRKGESLATRLSTRLESWMHRAVANSARPGAVLEIGAGSLNHLAYESSAAYDAVEPFAALYEGSPNRPKVRTIYKDMRDVPAASRYARVLSIAVLEHLERLPEVIARSGLLLEEGGLAQHAIPSEGGFLWGLAWRATTGLAYRLRTGLDYSALMRYEHINDHREIVEVLGWFFENLRIKRYPTPLFHMSFYTYVEASRPRLDRCRAYLESAAKNR